MGVFGPLSFGEKVEKKPGLVRTLEYPIRGPLVNLSQNYKIKVTDGSSI